MFQFPFGTMHQLNLDWFLQQWEIYKQEWAYAQAGIDNALQGEIDRVEDAMTDLYNARDVAVQAKEDAEDAADSVVSDAAQCGIDALKSEGFAVGEQDGTPVGAGSPYYQQNAKYYKVEAGTYRYLSEAYAKGEMGGSPVAPGEAGYQDNAKYYKDAADADAQQAHTDAQAIAANIDKAEGYAVGTQGGVPVSSGSPYYENNAAYYAAEAQQDKDDADHFKDAANQAALAAEGYSSGTQNGTPVSSGSPYYENNAAYFYGLSAGTSGDLAQDMIAPDEPSSVAAAKHLAGEYFRMAGILYIATSDIDIGDTISPYVNCLQTTVGDELYEMQNFSADAYITPEMYITALASHDFIFENSSRKTVIKKNVIENIYKGGSSVQPYICISNPAPYWAGTDLSTYTPTMADLIPCNQSDIWIEYYIMTPFTASASQDRSALAILPVVVDANNNITKLPVVQCPIARYAEGLYPSKRETGILPDNATHFIVLANSRNAACKYCFSIKQF